MEDQEKSMYTVFIVQCYEEREGDQLKDCIIAEIIANDYPEARRKAKKLTGRKMYRLNGIIQKYL